LLGFVDPEVAPLGVELSLENQDCSRLALRIAEIANAELEAKERVRLACARRQLSFSVRTLLADVVARLGSPDALVFGLNLIQDNGEPPIPRELVRGLEVVLFDKRPFDNTGGGSYALEPRSANEVRSRLFDMLLHDDERRMSAWSLLGQIEAWRLQYGRPAGEARHPAIESGEPWPPLGHNG
jgi:hypothetical protein